jgi:DNA repair protein RadC
VVDIRIILAAALKLLATGVLIAHNHPSGNLKPSSEDIKITKKLKGALELMDIVLLDHIILCPEHHYLSMSEEGILP